MRWNVTYHKQGARTNGTVEAQSQGEARRIAEFSPQCAAGYKVTNVQRA